MSDFTSDFWHWFIIAMSLGGIYFLVTLLHSNSQIKLKKGEEAKPTGHMWDGIEELNTPLPKWWANLFYLTIIFALGYLVLYPGLGSFRGLLNWTEIGEYQAEIKQAEETYDPLFKKYREQDLLSLSHDKAAMKTGKRLFSTYCSVCHGSDARGAKGFPNLRDSDWLWGGKPEQIEASILNGRRGTMPAWKLSLGEEGIEEVTAYVMSLSGRSVDESKVAAGKIHYKNCFGCHGVEGQGNTAMGAPNLTDKTWLYGAAPSSIKHTIAEGRSGVMPAHKDFLGEDRVHVLAAYVLSLSAKSKETEASEE